MNVLIIILITIFALLGTLSYAVTIFCLFTDAVSNKDEGFFLYGKVAVVCWAIALFGAIAYQLVGAIK